MLAHDGIGAVVGTSKATDYIATEPHVCPYCGISAQWFRNEHGKSLCIHCAIKKESVDAVHSS